MPVIALILLLLAASFVVLVIESALFVWAIQFTGIPYDPTLGQAMVLLLIIDGILITAGAVKFSRS